MGNSLRSVMSFIYLKSDPQVFEQRNKSKIRWRFEMKIICVPMFCLTLMAAVIVLAASPTPSMAGSCYNANHDHTSEK